MCGPSEANEQHVDRASQPLSRSLGQIHFPARRAEAATAARRQCAAIAIRTPATAHASDHGPALEPAGLAGRAGCGPRALRGEARAGAGPSGLADRRYPRGRKHPKRRRHGLQTKPRPRMSAGATGKQPASPVIGSLKRRVFDGNEHGKRSGNRTHDPLRFRQMLYPTELVVLVKQKGIEPPSSGFPRRSTTELQPRFLVGRGTRSPRGRAPAGTQRVRTRGERQGRAICRRFAAGR